MEKQIRKEYPTDDLTVVWQPAKCIHAGICVKMLPNVYDPKSKPWIKSENASSAELKAQIDKCPSGALSYILKTESEDNAPQENHVQIDVFENGPLFVHGKIKVKDKDGQIIEKEKSTAFCRCGHSSRKPFCDGAHKKEGFIG